MDYRNPSSHLPAPVEIEVLLDRVTDLHLHIREHEDAPCRCIERRGIKIVSKADKSHCTILRMSENRAISLNLV